MQKCLQTFFVSLNHNVQKIGEEEVEEEAEGEVEVSLLQEEEEVDMVLVEEGSEEDINTISSSLYFNVQARNATGVSGDGSCDLDMTIGDFICSLLFQDLYLYALYVLCRPVLFYQLFLVFCEIVSCYYEYCLGLFVFNIYS